jgi:3-methyladenine DNA glycosylase AlkD
MDAFLFNAEADRTLIGAIRAALQTVRDPVKAGPMQAYVKSDMPFLGVQKPELVKVLNPVLQAHPLPDAKTWQATVLATFREATYREEWSAALAILAWKRYQPWLAPDAMPLFETLIVEGAWWDIVDEVATRRLGPVLLSARTELTPTLREWATDEDRWKRRTSIIVQLKHKDETDLKLLAYAIEQNLADKDFFLRKAIGWALRQYARTDPEWVQSFVASYYDGLSNLSRREALRNLRKEGRAASLR